MLTAVEKFSTRALYVIVCTAGLVLLMILSGCGQDTPITPDAPPTAIIVNVNDPASVVGVPVTPIGVPLVSATRTPFPTITNVPPGVILELPACAPAIATPAATPENFAPNLFPPGLKLFQARTLENQANYLQVVGYAPLTLQDSVRFILDKYPKAGYTLGRGDSERTEAEATFSGNGWRGGFRINSLLNCPNATQWMIVVLKQ
jgi:hypothetical protein